MGLNNRVINCNRNLSSCNKHIFIDKIVKYLGTEIDNNWKKSKHTNCIKSK